MSFSNISEASLLAVYRTAIVIKLNYFGWRAVDVPESDPRPGFWWNFLVQMFYNPCARYAIYALNIFNAAHAVAIFFTALFQCMPMEANWDFALKFEPGTKCIDHSFHVIGSSLTIFTDLCILIIPFWIFLSLKMPRVAKIVVIGIFFLGSLIAVFCVIRVVDVYNIFFVTPDPDSDPYYNITVVYSSAEVNLIISTATMPTLRSLFRKWFPINMAGFVQPLCEHTHRRLHIFPLLASISWFSTLTILFARWISLGRPRYPGQVNPDVPFVSDIAAFAFKPIFIIGCTLTSIGFVGTVWSVHHVRYSVHFYGLTDDKAWRKVLSGMAMVSGLVAGGCLLLLSVFDTFEEHEKHRWLLVGTFGGLALSSLATEAVWWDETYKAARFPGLRKWCLVNTVLVLCIAVTGTLFLVFLYTDYYRRAGYLEWTITYLGSLWLGTFAGYIRFRERGGVARAHHEPEQQPLLSP
ncbi:uncharacterized protein J7T54_007629 [Emericellopsis cladophorae]|uniref:Uncharacterized protein n=1 Tax=Emericellopsis cladophorae TaxID=2686198 RepID=A0A9P9XW30_9HYPO|nr:uncharacterized protein J7T54_007629 [Emericellopsis cladophorae]KAI6778688.1 hypothetical protein J7T54_007629 [Emericellopsis cladophorae]